MLGELIAAVVGYGSMCEMFGGEVAEGVSEQVDRMGGSSRDMERKLKDGNLMTRWWEACERGLGSISRGVKERDWISEMDICLH